MLTIQIDAPTGETVFAASGMGLSALCRFTCRDVAGLCGIGSSKRGDAGESVSAPYAARPAMDDQFAGRGERGSTRASY